VDPNANARSSKRMEFATIIRSIQRREGKLLRIFWAEISMLLKRK
jgi:hypothetical protein